MRWAGAIGFVVLAGCGLPTKAVPGNCAKDDQCPAGWKCGSDKSNPATFYRCYCASDSCRDAGAEPDLGSDVGVTVDNTGKCQRNSDCPAEHPLCSTSGACVDCFNSSQCKDPGKSFCVATVCMGCQGAGAGACQSPTATCDATSGKCVECTIDAQCTADPNRPFCVANACAGCDKATLGACGKKDATKPACSPAGICVECNDSPDCTDGAKPICTSNKCGPCTTDAQCQTRNGPNPGVCMSHQDGHCATDGEAIYVQNAPACSAAAGAGTASMPFCKPQDALAAVSTIRLLVVIRGPAAVSGFSWSNSMLGQVSVIGQSNATIAGGSDPGIRLGAGNLYVRGVTVANSFDVGIKASGPGSITLERVVVSGNQGGGIQLETSPFQLRNAVVTGNGPGQLGALIWGGVLVKDVPAAMAQLDLVTLKDNKQVGLLCSGPVTGSGILSMGNAGGIDVGSACNVAACGSMAPTCGAQP
jgi:hypothetical protein